MVLVTASLIQSTNSENQYPYFGCCKALLLYSAVSNVVVRSSLTICATWKLPGAVSITDPPRILRLTTLSYLAAASFEVFSATAMA